MTYDRRRFLASLSCSLAASVVSQPPQPLFALPSNHSCWLEVTAPFIVEDRARGVSTEIILTSDTFAGARGHEEKTSATEYDIYLYDQTGRAIGDKGIACTLTVPAMHTTVIAARDLLGNYKPFLGGMKIRLRPDKQAVKHASDLFSSAFVRWHTAESFDNVHANPDPLEWQNTAFFTRCRFPRLPNTIVCSAFSIHITSRAQAKSLFAMHSVSGCIHNATTQPALLIAVSFEFRCFRERCLGYNKTNQQSQ